MMWIASSIIIGTLLGPINSRLTTYNPRILWSQNFLALLPTFANLFDLFWLVSISQTIVEETNYYATRVNMDENIYGGPQWELVSLESKTFIAIVLYMGMKQQPNVKTYWHKKGSIFHCPTISSLMFCNRFQLLTRCLHVTDPSTYESDKTMLG